MSILKAYTWRGRKSRTLSMTHSGQWKNFVCKPTIQHAHFEFTIKIKKYSQPAGSGFLSIGLRGIGVCGGQHGAELEEYVWMDSSSPGFKKGDQITVVAQKEEKLVSFKKNGKKGRNIEVDPWPDRGFEILPNREEILKKKELEETKRMEAMERRLLEEEKQNMRKDQEKWAFEERIKGTELQRQVEDLLVAFEKLRREHEELKLEHEELKKEHENTKNELESTRLTLEEVKSDYLEHKENHKNIN